jgi:hypothetical protein
LCPLIARREFDADADRGSCAWCDVGLLLTALSPYAASPAQLLLGVVPKLVMAMVALFAEGICRSGFTGRSGITSTPNLEIRSKR